MSLSKSASQTRDQPSTPQKTLKRGWTTGACATAAAKAALIGWVSGRFPPYVEIFLPRRAKPVQFKVEDAFKGTDQHQNAFAQASIIKDAGDDPDITHGCHVCARLSPNKFKQGISFAAGEGVGIVTRKGLPLDVGEPAINPAPRAMICDNLQKTADFLGIKPDFKVQISIPNGRELALKTRNAHLGIVGGLSILGTTGVVIPYSCASWVHSIYRAIDVARASNIDHLGASTGKTSQYWLEQDLRFNAHHILDVGDFVGAMAKYIKQHPITYLSFAGGFAKITKLALGAKNLHSDHGALDFDQIARWAQDSGLKNATVKALKNSHTAYQLYQIAGPNFADHVCAKAHERLQKMTSQKTKLNLFMISRDGRGFGRYQSFDPLNVCTYKAF
ncbi:MAG: cobalt-precorrin-5B (C(1))-methyltransferase [Pseudomonadota bacterium]